MQKVVLKLELQNDKDKQKALKSVSSLSGIDSFNMNMKEKKLTVIGCADPISILGKLRKHCHTEILTVGPTKEVKEEEPKKEKGKKGDEKKKDQYVKPTKNFVPSAPYGTPVPQASASYYPQLDTDYYPTPSPTSGYPTFPYSVAYHPPPSAYPPPLYPPHVPQVLNYSDPPSASAPSYPPLVTDYQTLSPYFSYPSTSANPPFPYPTAYPPSPPPPAYFPLPYQPHVTQVPRPASSPSYPMSIFWVMAILLAHVVVDKVPYPAAYHPPPSAYPPPSSAYPPPPYPSHVPQVPNYSDPPPASAPSYPPPATDYQTPSPYFSYPSTSANPPFPYPTAYPPPPPPAYPPPPYQPHITQVSLYSEPRPAPAPSCSICISWVMAILLAYVVVDKVLVGHG